MACGGCSKRRSDAKTNSQKKEDYDIMGGYGTLTDVQIKSRLEIYKRRYCKQCIKRYDCTFVIYLNCRKSNNNSV